MTENLRCVTDKELLERIVVLETEAKVRAAMSKDALVLAREILAKELELARVQMDERLEGHNQWQKRWDRNEGLLATKEEVSEKFQTSDEKSSIRNRNIERLVYIGVGLAIAVSYFLNFIKI